MTGFDGLLPPGLPPVSPPMVGEPAPNGDELGGQVDSDFAAALHRALRGVSDLQRDAHDKSMALVRGEPVQMHDVLVAMGKSEIAFNLALEVRNRLLQAWETLSRSTL